MNIFFTSNDPKKCAEYLDDKRVNKMVLETCQMLSTTLNYYGYPGPYKSTHINHPCTKWVRESRDNFRWAVHHFQSLCTEFLNRRKKSHKCFQYLGDFIEIIKRMPEGGLTPFPNCTRNKELGIDYSSLENVHEAYKKYLHERWKFDKIKPKWYGEI